jgi:hypothetical protein
MHLRKLSVLLPSKLTVLNLQGHGLIVDGHNPTRPDLRAPIVDRQMYLSLLTQTLISMVCPVPSSTKTLTQHTGKS